MSEELEDDAEDVFADEPVDSTEPIEYTQEVIDEMKALGFPKPDAVSWGDWTGPKDHSHRHDLLVNLAAAGFTNNEIAEELGFTASRVSIILSRTDIKKKVQIQQEKIFGKDTRKRLESLAKKGVETIETILDNPQERSTTKLDAAKYILDQSVGKAKGEIAVTGSMLVDVFHKLDELQSRQVSETPKLLDSKDESFDDFIENNVPKDFAIGKRSKSEPKQEA